MHMLRHPGARCVVRGDPRRYARAMWEWLMEHADLLSAISSIGMLVIWVLYLHLFFLTYRNQRRPNLLIHQADGFDLDSRCVIANMSETAVHVVAVLIDVEREGSSRTFQPRPAQEDDGGDPLAHTRQGPLPSASYMDVGSFGALVEAADDGRRQTSEEALDLRLTVRLVAFVGSKLYPAGAMRRFDVRGRRGDAEVRPENHLPIQLSNWRQRRVVRSWLEEAHRRERSSVATPTKDEEVGA
jgi:hypothetical protein